jgi:hypothetical protein
MLIVIEEITCLVAILRHLFHLNSQSFHAFLFRLIEELFSRVVVVNELKIRIINIEINVTSFTSHSFRKEIAQHALNNEMLNESIQRLER